MPAAAASVVLVRRVRERREREKRVAIVYVFENKNNTVKRYESVYYVVSFTSKSRRLL